MANVRPMLSSSPRAFSRPLPRRVVAGALVAALALSACGKSDEADTGQVAVDGLAACSPFSAKASAKAPTVPKIAEAADEVVQKDLTKGKGCAIGELTFANLNMLGATADGTVFLDTWKAGRPLSIVPMAGTLLPALSTALEGIEVGGIRQVTLPAADAYGKDGNEAQGIGPDTDLTFIVELISVSRGPEHCQDVTSLPEGSRPGKPETIEMPATPPTELETEDLVEGTGDAIKAGNFVKIEYTGVACSNGQEFDSSYNRDATFDFTAGAEGSIDGMSNGIIGAKKGGTRRIVIPAEQAYGQTGNQGIAPYEPLVFVVTVADVLESDPALTTTTTAAGATTTTVAGATTVPADTSTTVAP